MIRALGRVLALLVFAGCGVPVVDGSVCKAYVTCYEKTGGVRGSLDASYGAMGTCWSTTQEAANRCAQECRANLQRLAATYPDAGCLER